jgi:biopolymer transport protein ExbB
MRLEQAQNDAIVAQLAGSGREVTLLISGTRLVGRYGGGDVPLVNAIPSQGELTPGQWHHVVVRISSKDLAVLLDGTVVAQVPIEPVDISGTLSIGRSASGSGGLQAELDELQVAASARSNESLLAAARSQGMVAPLVSYGGDTQKEGGGESYFATTLRNVTVDGWVVIAVLVVMFFGSIAIMIGKILFLNRVVAGNAKFLGEFRKIKDDPTALERREGSVMDEAEDAVFETGGGSQLVDAMSSKDTFGVSTLWRLYHHGSREVMKRLQGQPAGADRVRTLSPQSIEAIRATMDAALTRMTQRLQSQMVWLTISISGGPFLGLLGTVVGVMITFAAIAASGDVNINAIAPGTAAALVATVAGLAVAIPCLFGYNYLNTRIKEITADMRVFVDEFVTRIAETYT